MTGSMSGSLMVMPGQSLEEPEPKERGDSSMSLCFPSISTTAYKFDLERAVPIACAVIKDFLQKNNDPRIRLYLVDLFESATLCKFREESKKVIPSNEERFHIKVANLVSLKEANIPCRYIVNASNPSFTDGGSGTNKAIHSACKGPWGSLKKLSKSIYRDINEIETAKAYPVPLPPECPLRQNQDVHAIIHVVGPNRNPTRVRYLEDQHEAEDLLKKSYEDIFRVFYLLATTLKSSESDYWVDEETMGKV